MAGTCSIIMYHYVRELGETRYPRIRGLTETKFRAQLAYLRKHYRFVTLDEVLEALHGGATLPANSALLTFDDGYADHYQSVFPILDREGIQGCFFPPVRAVAEGVVLDVNKIHFVLASVGHPDELLGAVRDQLDALRSEGYAIERDDALYERLAKPGKFDPPELVFVKRLLQRELAEELRARIVDNLFRQYVTGDERAFARELYVSVDQLKVMRRYGMVIGGHGYSHRWLDSLRPDEQRLEIDASVSFLRELGVSGDGWMMCYPYGAHDASLREICAGRGCRVAVTTETAIADVEAPNALTLPRLDTNYLPTDPAAEPVQWTIDVTGRES